MPSQLFNFTKYFKKDANKPDDSTSASNVQTTTVSGVQPAVQNPGTYNGIGNPPGGGQTYSGIGNPPQNQAQNPVQNSPVPPPAEQVQNTEANSGLGQAQAETPGVKDSTDPTKSSIDMGKRV